MITEVHIPRLWEVSNKLTLPVYNFLVPSRAIAFNEIVYNADFLRGDLADENYSEVSIDRSQWAYVLWANPSVLKNPSGERHIFAQETVFCRGSGLERYKEVLRVNYLGRLSGDGRNFTAMRTAALVFESISRRAYVAALGQSQEMEWVDDDEFLNIAGVISYSEKGRADYDRRISGDIEISFRRNLLGIFKYEVDRVSTYPPYGQITYASRSL